MKSLVLIQWGHTIIMRAVLASFYLLNHRGVSSLSNFNIVNGLLFHCGQLHYT